MNTWTTGDTRKFPQLTYEDIYTGHLYRVFPWSQLMGAKSFRWGSSITGSLDAWTVPACDANDKFFMHDHRIGFMITSIPVGETILMVEKYEWPVPSTWETPTVCMLKFLWKDALFWSRLNDFNCELFLKP